MTIQSARTRGRSLETPRQRGILLGATLLGAILLTATVASAGPNAGGTIFVHAVPGEVYTTDGEPYCNPALESCADANTTVPSGPGGPYVWRVSAAFSCPPRLGGAAFGIQYTPGVIVTAFGHCADFELAMPGWPASGTGTALHWDAAQQDEIVPLYWFAGYGAYAADLFFATPHPELGAIFLDDQVPPVPDIPICLGALGFGPEPGILCCPEPCTVPTEETTWGRIKESYGE